MKPYPWPVRSYSEWMGVPRARVDAVLFGAGVSKPVPTSAPLGPELAYASAIALLKSSGADRARGVVDEVAKRANSTGMRLESVMQTWWDVTHSTALFAAYEVLQGLPPNDNHHLLAQMLPDTRLLTLNMDKCVEAAADCQGIAPNVTHLHGTCDDLDSIKTTIEAYDEGLAPPLAADLARSVRGRHVLVVGYSGQDSDVVPQLAAHPPASVTWMQYNPKEDLGVEAESVLHELWDAGTPVQVVTGDPTQYLRVLVDGAATGSSTPTTGATGCTGACTASPPPPGPPRVDEELEKQPQTDRVLAASTVLATLGMWDEAAAHVGAVPDHDAKRPRALKLQGRFLRLAGRPNEAADALGWPPLSVPAMRRFTYSTNEALAAGLEAHSPAALAVHGVLAHLPRRLLPGARGQLLARSARSRFAQHLNMRGHFAAAQRLADNALTTIDSTNFGALASQTVYLVDVLKTRGEYVEGLERLAQLHEWVTFMSVHTQADFRWKRGELLTLAGDTTSAIEDLDWVTAATRLMQSPDQTLWHLSTSMAVHPADDDLAAEVTDRVQRAAGSSLAATCFGLFALTERHASTGDLDSARKTLMSADARLSRTGRWWRLPTYELTAKYLTLRTDPTHDYDLARRFAELGRRFHRVGMTSMVMRCAILAARAAAEEVPDAAVEACRTRKWDTELLLANKGPWSAYLTLVL